MPSAFHSASESDARSRNPTWSRDELILALDFYLRHRDRLPGKESDAIRALSQELNALAAQLRLSGDAWFRNESGVYMKLLNFRRFDPSYTESGRVGLSHGGKGDELVWNDFALDPPRLEQVAKAIRQGISAASPLDIDPEDDELAEAPEGRILTQMHRVRERNRGLVRSKKQAFLRRHGRLFCEACGFDFVTAYGERGDGFMECHHTKPVHTLDPGQRTSVRDLALLCADCHRMVHVRSPWLTIEELRQRILARSKQQAIRRRV